MEYLTEEKRVLPEHDVAESEFIDPKIARVIENASCSVAAK